MNNPTLEQALLELNESLEQIRSANDNVNNVSQKSEELITHMNMVIESLNAITANINIDKQAINNQLSENYKTLQEGFAKLLNDANDSYIEIQNQLENNQSEFSRALVDLTNEIQSQLNTELEKYKTAIRITLISVEKEIGIMNNQINTLKESTLKVESTSKDFQNRLDNIDIKSEFAKFNKSISLKVNVLSLINILVLLGMLAAFLYKMGKLTAIFR